MEGHAKTQSNQRIGTSYLPSQVVQAPTEIILFRSLYVQCTDLAQEPIRLFLDLLRVLQDTLNLKSPTSLLKSPGLYTVEKALALTGFAPLTQYSPGPMFRQEDITRQASSMAVRVGLTRYRA